MLKSEMVKGEVVAKGREEVEFVDSSVGARYDVEGEPDNDIIAETRGELYSDEKCLKLYEIMVGDEECEEGLNLTPITRENQWFHAPMDKTEEGSLEKHYFD